jgi:predicted TIM-barrel fold metal-dependent hydrolase
MLPNLSRRELLAGALVLAPALRGAIPTGRIVETNLHVYPEDVRRFPFHPNRTYTPGFAPLEPYLKFVKEAHVGPVVIVHPSPYQDDHRVLEYCFENEPSPGFFKGTCFFDPIDPKTPARMKELSAKHPGRIKALRIFEDRKASDPPTTTGTIRDRDLRDPRVKTVWKAAGSLGMAIQMVPIPGHAPQIHALAAEIKDTRVIIDHLSAPTKGTPAEYEEVLKLGKLPNVVMKFTSLRGATKEEFPHKDLQVLSRRVFEAFGPDRMMWGTFGGNMDAYEKNAALFDHLLDFASESDRAKIRGLTALKVFDFKV